MLSVHLVAVGTLLASIATPNALASAGDTCTTFKFGSSTSVAGINNKGEVVGVWTDANQQSHTFLRRADGTVISLTSPSGGAFSPTGINNFGQVAGPSFILNPDGTYINIAPPVSPPGDNYILGTTKFTGINDKGELSGSVDGSIPDDPSLHMIFVFIRGADGHYRITHQSPSSNYPSRLPGELNNSGSVVVHTRYTDGFLLLSDGQQIPNLYPSLPYDSGSPGGCTDTSGVNNNNVTVARVKRECFNPYPPEPAVAFIRTLDGQYPEVSCPQAMGADLIPGGINDYNAVAGSFNGTGFISMPAGPLTSIQSSEQTWNFSAHVVGDTSGNGRIVISNPGVVDLHIPTLWIGGTGQHTDHVNSFRITHTNCTPPTGFKSPKTIPPGETCNVNFTFIPEAAGWQSAAIYVSNDSPNDSPLIIRVGGTGVSSTLKLSNTTWQFSAHPVGETSGTGKLYMTNTGHAAVTFNSIKIVEPGPTSNFNLVGNTCGSTLAPSVTCALMFNFAPKTSGAHLAWLNVSVSSDKRPIEIPFSGYAP